MAGLLFLKKEMMLDLKESRQAFCPRGREERENFIPCRGADDRKGAEISCVGKKVWCEE